MFEKCEGIVIRTIDYGETNKIVTIFTREWGKVAAMARGAKKPSSRLSSVTQMFTYGIYLIQKSRGVGSLQQGELLSTMRHIREDIFLTAYASYVVELTDKATEDRRPNPYLFELLLQTLTYMNEGLDAEVLTYIYEMKLLPAFGLYPKLDGCAVCGEKEGTFAFSIAQGGFLCHRCFEHDPHRIPMTPSVLKLLRLFYYVDLSRIGQIAVKQETKQQLQTIISAYYDEYSGLSLRTKRFLQQLHTLKGEGGQI